MGKQLGEYFDSFGKALAAVGGIAIVVYVVGGLGFYARLQRQGLPPEAVIPEIPRERLALLGLTQLLVTIVLGLVIVWLARRLPARGPFERRSAWHKRLLRSTSFLVLTAIGFAIALLLTPWSWNGRISFLLLVGAYAWFLAWGRRVAPVTLFVVALSVAVAFTVLRQFEFPTPQTVAAVTLTKEGAELIPQARAADESELLDSDFESGPQQTNYLIRGRVVAITDDELLLGWESRAQLEREEQSGVEEDLTLVRIPRSAIGGIAYDLPKDPVSFSDSLGERLIPGLAPDFKCIIPICQNGSHEEHRAYGIPFVS